MANIIKIKRGLKANLPALAIGELAYCTDTKELFIGVNTGTSSEPVLENVLVALDPEAIFDDPTFTGDVKLGSNSTLTGIPIPVDPDSAVNKEYVDNLLSGSLSLEPHISAEYPHRFTDDGIEYEWGIAVQDGQIGIIFREVETNE